MAGGYHGEELPFHHRRARTPHDHRDPALPAVAPLHLGLRLEPVGRHHGAEELRLGAGQHHGRLVDGQHGRVVGQAERESAVDEAARVRRHLGAHVEHDPRTPGGQLHRLPAQVGGDPIVRLRPEVRRHRASADHAALPKGGHVVLGEAQHLGEHVGGVLAGQGGRRRHGLRRGEAHGTAGMA